MKVLRHIVMSEYSRACLQHNIGTNIAAMEETSFTYLRGARGECNCRVRVHVVLIGACVSEEPVASIFRVEE